MRSLFSADETTTGPAPVQWFAFERDVKHLMERLGFTVQHVAAARSGDRGVDLYATKGTDFDLVNWVVQCKCYHPRRSVGPAIVRELVGALAAYPKGTRGMLVTTSSFTPEADAVASEHQVRLVNGAEFQLLLNRDPPSDSTE